MVRVRGVRGSWFKYALTRVWSYARAGYVLANGQVHTRTLAGVGASVCAAVHGCKELCACLGLQTSRAFACFSC